ncbi:MAG: L-lysine 6-transaminase [Planctomycetota bacterium]|nr:MAG: L-lysine 6-transaminase [Planctomycetota bacterium]
MTTNTTPEIAANEVIDTLLKHVRVDGPRIVIDMQASHGSYMVNALDGREYLDFYSFFASMPLGYNHPRLREPEYQARLLTAASMKVANSDVFSEYYAQFVQTVADIAAPDGFEHFFFIDGGALAVENALKAAFDWKVRKNLAAGRGEIGQQVIHFKQAFHGRSGYTMSLTNTADPRKTMYFPKFDWPRIDNPKIDFTLDEPQRTEDVAQREQAAVEQIMQAIEKHGHDLAAIIIEPIQGEGGDNHFRGEFLAKLREICDQHEMLLIFDEVQTGLGLTGRLWAFEHFDVVPDILVFGKKMQICGLMAGGRLDDVDNVFKVPSRINSTFGGNMTDMVRAAQYLRVIEEEGLVQNAAEKGELLLNGLRDLAARHDCISAVRGRGLWCAFDLPDGQRRDALREACLKRQMLVLACGPNSIRFRPVLDVTEQDIDRGLEVLDAALGEINSAPDGDA